MNPKRARKLKAISEEIATVRVGKEHKNFKPLQRHIYKGLKKVYKPNRTIAI